MSRREVVAADIRQARLRRHEPGGRVLGIGLHGLIDLGQRALAVTAAEEVARPGQVGRPERGGRLLVERDEPDPSTSEGRFSASLCRRSR